MQPLIDSYPERCLIFLPSSLVVEAVVDRLSLDELELLIVAEIPSLSSSKNRPSNSFAESLNTRWEKEYYPDSYPSFAPVPFCILLPFLPSILFPFFLVECVSRV